jgi:biotin operon repressor
MKGSIGLAEDRHFSEILNFFKALSDENRLKIVGLLAQQPYTVEKLADALGLSVSTTSHHLSRLASAGLVTVRVEGHYYYYSLQMEVLRKMTQQMMKDEEIARLSQSGTEDEFARKVMRSFVNAEGRIIAFPAQEKKYRVILEYVVKSFEVGEKYSEKQVNEILSRFHQDTSSLRRALIEHKMMQRESNGSAYWRTEVKKEG